MVRQEWQAQVRQGNAGLSRHGRVWLGIAGEVGSGGVRHDMAWQGWFGEVRPGRRGAARMGKSGLRHGRQGEARVGKARYG